MTEITEIAAGTDPGKNLPVIVAAVAATALSTQASAATPAGLELSKDLDPAKLEMEADKALVRDKLKVAQAAGAAHEAVQAKIDQL
jgi:hypothetical protein